MISILDETPDCLQKNYTLTFENRIKKRRKMGVVSEGWCEENMESPMMVIVHQRSNVHLTLVEEGRIIFMLRLFSVV